MSTFFPLPRQTREAFLVATEGQTEFGPFDFILFGDDDVDVLTRAPGAVGFVDATAGTNVLPVSLEPPYLPGLFSIVFDEGLDAGTEVWVRGARLHARLTNVTQGGAIRSTPLELELDRMAAILQELRRDLDRDFPPVATGNVSSNEINTIKVLTQAQYDALAPADGNTLYLIV